MLQDLFQFSQEHSEKEAPWGGHQATEPHRASFLIVAKRKSPPETLSASLLLACYNVSNTAPTVSEQCQCLLLLHHIQPLAYGVAEVLGYSPTFINTAKATCKSQINT